MTDREQLLGALRMLLEGPGVDEVRLCSGEEVDLIATLFGTAEKLPAWQSGTLTFGGVPVVVDTEVPPGVLRFMRRGRVVDEAQIGDAGD